MSRLSRAPPCVHPRGRTPRTQRYTVRGTQPGTLLVFLEPLYTGGLEGVTPGSSCIANAYSNNHELIASKDTARCEASHFTLWMHSRSYTP